MAAHELVLCTGNANTDLARRIAAQLGRPLARVNVGAFDDGECRVQFIDDVRNKHVVIIQPTNQPDRNQTELELMIRACRSSAKFITAFVPYLGYSRQDRKTATREPISAVQRMRNIISAGADNIAFHDLHAGQLQAVGEAIDPRVQIDHTISRPVILEWLAGQDLNHAMVSSVDAGGAKMVESYWTRLRTMGYAIEFGIAHKSGTSSVGINSIKLLGDYEGRDVYFVDDMITTGGSATEGASVAKKLGARSVTFIASHAVMANNDVAQRIADSVIDRFVVTNTIAIQPEHRAILGDKLVEISNERLFALIIKHLHEGRSLSMLFELDGLREAQAELETIPS